METQYTRTSDGMSLAYQRLGQSGPVMVCVPGALSNLLFADIPPSAGRTWERSARFCRVVRYDKRGTGLSDRSDRGATLEEQVHDVDVIREAVGAERVVLNGLSQGAAISILYARAHPERVEKLILAEGVCCDAHDPYAPPERAKSLIDWDAFFADLETDFAAFSRRLAAAMLPDVNSEFAVTLPDFIRATASPQSLRSLWQAIVGLDLRPLLADLDIPTLVIHARGDGHHPVAHGRYLAEHIPGARYLELDGDYHVPHMSDEAVNVMLPVMEEFLTGDVHHTAERRFSAVLFADVVNSTTEQSRRGDRAWRDVLESFEETARKLVERHTGRIVKFQGDGVMASFGTAGEALRAARALSQAVSALKLEMRAGVHAGEVYDVEGDIFGASVNVAARICDQAGAGEVLSTQVVEGLVEGDGFVFEDRGQVELKGVGTRRLLRLV